MSYLEIKDEIIYFRTRDNNSKYNLIFVHGSGGDYTHWPLSLLKNKNFNTYLIDLPSHGRSKGRIRKSVTDFSDFITHFVKRLSLKNVILCGHSLGGAIVLQSALKKEDWLSGIVLVGTGARLRVLRDILEGLKNNYKKTINLVVSFAFGSTAKKELKERIRRQYLKTPSLVTYYDFNACNEFDVMAELEHIALPALIFSGSEDKLTPLKYGNYLNDNLKNSIHVILEGCGHMMALEKEIEFINFLNNFIKSL